MRKSGLQLWPLLVVKHPSNLIKTKPVGKNLRGGRKFSFENLLSLYFSLVF